MARNNTSIPQVLSLGVSWDDAHALRRISMTLRRISMTLRRWHELECGSDSGAIERDETTGKAYWLNSTTGRRWPTADRETGARKRLARIMGRYPSLQEYVQGDPRGCALYLLRASDLLEGQEIGAYYSRGVAVY